MSTKRELATQLGVVTGFDDPTAALEQYPTPPELAAHVIHLADLYDDVDDRTIVDLGTGTGMLAIAAALRGPDEVIGVEIDRTALGTAVDNRRRVGTATPIHWVQADVNQLPIGFAPDVSTTVVMNPPFGAQDGAEGADRGFLEATAGIADVSYSIHNAGSLEFVEAFAADNGGDVTHAFEADFEMERQFDHHEEEKRVVPTEVYRIDWQ